MAPTGCGGRMGGGSPAVALRGCMRAQLQRARRDNRDGGLGYPVRVTGGGGRASEVPEPVGRKKTPDPVGRITCNPSLGFGPFR